MRRGCPRVPGGRGSAASSSSASRAGARSRAPPSPPPAPSGMPTERGLPTICKVIFGDSGTRRSGGVDGCPSSITRHKRAAGNRDRTGSGCQAWGKRHGAGGRPPRAAHGHDEGHGRPGGVPGLADDILREGDPRPVVPCVLPPVVSRQSAHDEDGLAGADGSRSRPAWPSVRKESAQLPASRRSSLGPAGDHRSRHRSGGFGLMGCPVTPPSIRVSTTEPWGTSMATPMTGGAA